MSMWRRGFEECITRKEFNGFTSFYVIHPRINLLPVIDLNGYLNGELAGITPKSRVLVIDCDGIYSGLVVDEVLGLKHFREQELIAEDSSVDANLQPYCHGGFRRGEQTLAIFSMYALASAPQFLQAAV